MPPVASDATAPAYQPSLPNPAWAAPSSGRTINSPFDALLDTSTQTALQPPQSSPPSNDKTPPKAQSNSDQSSGQGSNQAMVQIAVQDPIEPAANPSSKDTVKAADANADQPIDRARVADTAAGLDTLIKDFKASKANQDAKTGKLTDKQAAAGEDSKATGNAKQDDTTTPANPTDITTINAIQTAIPVVAPAVVAQDVPAKVLQAVAAIGPLSISGAETTKTKSAGGAAAKPDVAKLAPDTKTSVQSADGKQQSATSDADKLMAAPQHDAAQTGKSHSDAAPGQPAIAPDAQIAAPKIDAGAAQQVALTTQTPDIAQTAATPAAPAPQAVQALAVPLSGVAIEIAGKALGGKNHFEIRLDPPELGRIEVRLDVDKDGNTSTHMIADRSDTLNLLRNDSSDLQRALQDAGLKTSGNGMQFSLRDQSTGQQQGNNPTPGAAQIVVNDDVLAASDIIPRSYPRLAGMGSGIDIRV